MFSVLRYSTVLLLSVLVAGFAFVAYTQWPLGALVHPDMGANFNRHPIAIYMHVFCAALALLIGPFQFPDRLRRARPRLHRWLGRIYLGVGVGLGGIAGLYMAMFAYAGIVAKLGFVGLALAWLYTGARAYQHARDRDFVAHRAWMLRNFSLTFAAVTLRIYLGVSIASGWQFAVFYPVIAWLCWLPNAAVGEWLARRVETRASSAA